MAKLSNQCLGRTRTFRRCRRQGRVFCHHHRWQPWTAFFGVLAVLASVFGLYQDLWKELFGPDDLHPVILRLDTLIVAQGDEAFKGGLADDLVLQVIFAYEALEEMASNGNHAARDALDKAADATSVEEYIGVLAAFVMLSKAPNRETVRAINQSRRELGTIAETRLYYRPADGDRLLAWPVPDSVHDGSFNHHDPIAMVLHTVAAPASLGLGRDIAVAVDLPGRTPRIVHYQRNVTSGQQLSFDNVVVAYDPQWDSRVGPLMVHVRILDVTDVSNAYLRELLARTGTASNASDTDASQGTLASLILAEPTVAVVLDTIADAQFLSAGQPGFPLELVEGRYYLVGRPVGSPSNIWRNTPNVATTDLDLTITDHAGREFPYIAFSLIRAAIPEDSPTP